MKPIGFHSEARTEAVESACYYEEQQIVLGKRFFVALQDRFTHIQNQPQLYPGLKPTVSGHYVTRGVGGDEP